MHACIIINSPPPSSSKLTNMSPSRDSIITSQRPYSSLKINKDSSSSSTTTSSTSSSSSSSSPPPPSNNRTTNSTKNPSNTNNGNTNQRPVIIYTHQPEVIHTPACNFMALVQKLTGMSPQEARKPGNESANVGLMPERNVHRPVRPVVGKEEKTYPRVAAPVGMRVPFYATNSVDLNCTPRMYRYQDALVPPNVAGGMSPTMRTIREF